MKQLFILLIIANSANAQLKTQDSVCYSTHCAKIYRMDEPFRNKLAKRNFDYFSGLQYLETRLDQLRLKATGHKEITTREADDIHNSYFKNNKKCTGNDEYNEEIEFYQRYAYGFYHDITRDLINQKYSMDSISKVKAIENNRIAIIRQQADETERDEKEKIRAEEKRIDDEKYQKEYLAECIKKFGSLKGKKIANGEIELGMTKEMCEYAKGSLFHLMEFIKDGVRCQIWRYDSGLWLTFKGDKLVLIDN